MTGTWPTGWATNDIVSAGEYAKGMGCIYDTTLGAGAASIDVTGIIANYAHLMIVGYLRGDTVAQVVDVSMRFNGDSAANYGYVGVGQASAGAAVNFNSITASTLAGQAAIAAASATAGGFSPFWALIPHYAGSANHKSCDYSYGCPSSTTAAATASARVNGVWRSTAAITRVTIALASGNIVTGSRLSIYAMGS